MAKKYQQIKSKISVAKEPMVAYQKSIHQESVRTMPLEQALKMGISLKDSKNIIMSKVRKDFPEFQF